ncbi:MAG TPA: hypothetical protein VHF87_10180 [Methylomirabilota bacterium]|jgi:hypothetical protein|nr:hypothetical protein [Methylomirabilota bacterium]
MAHRRALSQPRTRGVGLLVAGVLALDAAAALTLEGRAFPMGVVVPEAVLLAAPLLVYGILAFLLLRTRPLGLRFAALAVLLGIHAGLVALHTVAYIGLWSLPAPAALRLAHRWSPLIPLLQLVWVPLLALPLRALVNRRPPARSYRRGPAPGRGDAQAPRSPHAGRARVEPVREGRAERGAPGLAPATRPETVPASAPEPAPSRSAPAAVTPIGPEVSVEPSPVPATRGEPRPLVPEPTWFDELLRSSSEAVPPGMARVEADAGVAAAADTAPSSILAQSVAVAAADAERAGAAMAEPAAVGVPEGIAVVTVEPVAASPPSVGDALDDDLPQVTEVAAAAPVPVPAIPAPAVPPPPAEPPLDLDRIARVFAPYGPLLSRDRAVVVDWTPGPDLAVVCVAPREISRDRVLRLAARLAGVLGVVAEPAVPGLVGRLSLRARDGVVVLTPLDDAVLVAAARRPGALALLEVLSRRVGRPEEGEEPGDGEPGGPLPSSAAGPALVDLRPALAHLAPPEEDAAARRTVRVVTPTAWFDVVAPQGIEAEPVGRLAGRLVAALADGGAAGAADLHTLHVEFPAHRLAIHPVHPHTSPPRFVAVVGGLEPRGLLGRRAEQFARELREVS